MRRSPFHITRLMALLVLAAAVAGCAGTDVTDALPLAQATAEPGAGPVEASGFLEAEEVNVVSERDGRVAEVRADEADTVEAGDVVVVLDDTLLQSDRLEAEAAVRVAEANLAEVTAGPRRSEVRAAEAAIEQAEAQAEGAARSSGQAWVTASDPKDIDVQIASARLELSQRQGELDQARSQLAQLEREIGIVSMVPEGEELDQTRMDFLEISREQLVAQVAAAEARRDGAQHKLDVLQAQRERPVALIAEAVRAQAQIPVAEAQLELARAQYDLLVADPLAEEIAIAEAQVALAEAQVALVDAQIRQLTLTAPIGGTVTTRSIAPGETATAGRPLMTIASLSRLKLTVYIAERQIGRVQIGAPVTVTVNAHPDREFEGRVGSIAREAEFTPSNVLTDEERVNLVFAVEIEVPNEDGELKPGMPAEAVIETEG